VGEEPFTSSDQVISGEIGIRALQMLRELLHLCDPACFERNPIATLELLSSGDTAAYCPFAYGYSNYSRRGYSDFPLTAGGLVSMDGGKTLRSTLGGAGLAISAECRHKKIAAQYTQYVASAECQKGLYFSAGGQPGHRSAWLDQEVNRSANGFFHDTLPVLDTAYLRPRFNGYLRFQNRGAHIVHEYLKTGKDVRAAMKELDQSLAEAKQQVHNL
jgi:multiple sugar transport system substrate-binding protein